MTPIYGSDEKQSSHRLPLSPALLAQAADIEPGACYPLLPDGTISPTRCAADDTLAIVTWRGADAAD